MPRLTTQQTNFTAGELSPRLYGHTDIARYQNGARTIRNALPLVHGGIRRRYGSLFVGEAKHADKACMLVPYVFSRDQSYMLEFGDLYIRVIKDGSYVEASPGVPYEVVTTYTEAMLPDLGFVQGADTMFLVHPNVAPRRLRRFDHDNWVLGAVPFLCEPFSELGTNPATTLTLSATTGTGVTATAGAATWLASDVGRDISYRGGVATITAVGSSTSATVTISSAFEATALASGSWTLLGTPQTKCTPSAKDPIGATITLTLTADGWRSEDIGKYVQLNSGLCRITTYTSATVVSATIVRELTSTVAAEADAWTLEKSMWGGSHGYPRAVALYEQRLLFAGSPGFPQHIWGSRAAGEYFDFTLGSNDDDAFSFQIASEELNHIQHLASIRKLHPLTVGGEFAMSSTLEKPLTPTNVQIRNQSFYGASAVRPARVGNELLFVQRGGRKLRAMASTASDQEQPFGAADLSVLAEHITEGGIVSMCFQKEPDPFIWAVRADGVLLSVTFDREQEVIGWAGHDTDGLFESVACIPTGDGEEVYAVVKRTIGGSAVRYIERLSDTLLTDCGITGTSGPGAATWAGLDHLEGKDVDCVADGAYMGQFTVTGGEITLPRDATAVAIGLPYTVTIELLTPELPVGTIQGNSMRTSEVSIHFLESVYCSVNGDSVEFRRFGSELLDQPPEPFTGLKRIENLGWDRGTSDITITQAEPVPLHILSVIRKFQVND